METTAEIRREAGGWVVRVEGAGGAAQEFTCATEEMARRLAERLTRAPQGRSPPDSRAAGGGRRR